MARYREKNSWYTQRVVPSLMSHVIVSPDRLSKCPLCFHRVTKGELAIDNVCSGFWGSSPKFRTLHLGCWLFQNTQDQKLIKRLIKPSQLRQLSGLQAARQL